MLKKLPLFEPLGAKRPVLEQLWNTIGKADPFMKRVVMRDLKYKFNDTRVLMVPKLVPTTVSTTTSSPISVQQQQRVTEQEGAEGERQSHIIAFPFHVTREVSNIFNTMHGGALMSLVDMCSSVHLAERLLPSMDGHVSVSLNTKFLTPAVQGTDIVVLTRVDKLGKKLAFLSVDIVPDFVVPPSSSSPDPDNIITHTHHHHVPEKDMAADKVAADTLDATVRTPQEFDEWLSVHRRAIATGTHVKSIIPDLKPPPTPTNTRR